MVAFKEQGPQVSQFSKCQYQVFEEMFYSRYKNF